MISVVIPLFNKEKTIPYTIESILKQSINDYEIVIVDDGSTDNGPDFIKKIKSEKITILSQKNQGPSAARNLGVKKAKGEWIVFMDADDWFEPNAFEVFSSITSKQKKCDFFCFNYYIEQNSNRFLYANKYPNGYVRNNYFAWCAGLCMPRAGASLIRKELLLKHPFNENLHRYEDAASIFELMRLTRIYRSDIPVMTYNCHSSAASLPCKDIALDFIGHLDFKNKSFWEQYALYQLYKQGLELYPNDMSQLYHISIIQKFKYKFAAVLIGRMKTYNII